MLPKIVQDKVYCGLDIGSDRIKSCIIKVKDFMNFELLGVYETSTKGYKNGAVSDLGELSECLHHNILQLTKKISTKIKEISVGVGGELINSRETSSMIPLVDRGSKVIGGRDIRKVNNQARMLGMKIGEEILHDLPLQYNVDEVSSALNPFGLYGRKLGVNSLLIVALANNMRNIHKAVHQAGYEVLSASFSSYIANLSVLDDEQKHDGVALVDIGSRTCNVMVFKDKVLKYFERFNNAGEQLTSLISRELNLSFELSEQIKKSYAAAITIQSQQDEEILVKKDNNYLPIKRESICRAIEPGVEIILNNIGIGTVRMPESDQLRDGDDRRGIAVIGAY